MVLTRMSPAQLGVAFNVTVRWNGRLKLSIKWMRDVVTRSDSLSIMLFRALSHASIPAGDPQRAMCWGMVPSIWAVMAPMRAMNASDCNRVLTKSAYRFTNRCRNVGLSNTWSNRLLCTEGELGLRAYSR